MSLEGYLSLGLKVNGTGRCQRDHERRKLNNECM